MRAKVTSSCNSWNSCNSKIKHLVITNRKVQVVGELVEVKVGSLESVHTQTPIKYYDLPFCAPDKIVMDVTNLGDILMGDSKQNTPYVVSYREDKSCTKLCEKSFSEAEAQLMVSRIDDKYKVHWQVDFMLSLMRLPTTNNASDVGPKYTLGFPVGGIDKGGHFVNNHVSMTLLYHTRESTSGGGRIVGFEVMPRSVEHQVEDGKLKCDSDTLAFVSHDKPTTFSYDVTWESSDVPWSSRFSIYLQNSRDSPVIHWFSIVNSLVILLLLSAVVAMILLRVLYRDIAKYNEMDDEEAAEESGWKLVHGDVFRKPPHSTLLAALTGSGVQILCMLVITVVCACLGVFSPTYRGRLLQSMLVLWAVGGVAAGYTAARLYKSFKSTNWKMTMMRTSLIFPGVCFCIFFLLNLVLAYERSSAAVPFSALIALLAMWFLISTPLILVGGYLGFRESAISVPVRVNKIPRQIPVQPWFMSSTVSCLIGGALPFGAMYVELFFLFSSIWQHRFYYLFGFLALVLVIIVITCAEISLTLVYFQLVCEDYSWWWRSFLASATSGLYVFVYSLYYFYTKLRLTRLSGVLLYLGYSLIMAYGFFILTGAIGFLSSFFFLRKIYASIKVD
eukprot:GHVS01059542.1.p1 GENE.GHVS01059542.1~~GHVS01059542.1.p1  ORF type:complete len:617 (+),score=61.79 GHVS01059542.1:253-2103(+)